MSVEDEPKSVPTDTDDPPKSLWRVVSIRKFRGQDLRHTNWLHSKASAEKHVEWINDGRGRVLSIKEYKRADSCE